jgi:hypothetical protein
VQTIIPTDEQKEKACELSKEMGHIRNSITKGQGNFAGFIAEIIVADLLNAERSPTKDYDLILNDGRTVDVKTKRTTVIPKPYYDCSIAATSTHQGCDLYVFTRYMEGGALYILGDCSKEDYFNRARFLKRGEKDGDNGFIVKADCYNLPISELTNLVV